MDLFSFTNFDITTSIFVLVITVIGVYWFWLKSRLSSPTNSQAVIKTTGIPV